nr:hypothetical protein [Oryza sativa Indica Group]
MTGHEVEWEDDVFMGGDVGGGDTVGMRGHGAHWCGVDGLWPFPRDLIHGGWLAIGALKGFWMVVAGGSNGDVAWDGKSFSKPKPNLFYGWQHQYFQGPLYLIGGGAAVFSSLPRKPLGENSLLIPRVGSGGAYEIATSLEALFEGPIYSLYSLSSYGGASVYHSGTTQWRVDPSFSLAHSLS